MPGTVGATVERGLRGSVVMEPLSLQPQRGVKERHRLPPHLCVSVRAFSRLKRNLIIQGFLQGDMNFTRENIRSRCDCQSSNELLTK